MSMRLPFLFLIAASFFVPGAVGAESERVELSWVSAGDATIDLGGPIPRILLPEAVRELMAGEFPGYRLPESKDYKFDWISFYEDDKTPFLVLGDFNHDGQQDIAVRLIGAKDNFWKLVIFHKEKGSFSAYVLMSSPDRDKRGEIRDYGMIQRYGLDLDMKCDCPPCLGSYVYESAGFSYMWSGDKYEKLSVSD